VKEKGRGTIKKDTVRIKLGKKNDAENGWNSHPTTNEGDSREKEKERTA
jgi:hypothetical protein